MSPQDAMMHLKNMHNGAGAAAASADPYKDGPFPKGKIIHSFLKHPVFISSNQSNYKSTSMNNYRYIFETCCVFFLPKNDKQSALLAHNNKYRMYFTSKLPVKKAKPGGLLQLEESSQKMKSYTLVRSYNNSESRLSFFCVQRTAMMTSIQQ